jgi:hypothetical protein
MNKHSKTFGGLSLALLFAASPLACIGEAVEEAPPGASAVEVVEDTDEAAGHEAAGPAGDGQESGEAGLKAPAEIDNSAACGEHTLAVVNAPTGATYVFCGFGDGKTGVLEELPGGDPRESLLDVYPVPADLLRAVAPEGVEVPDHLIASVEAGRVGVAEESRSMYPVKLGKRVKAPASLLGHYCSNPTEFTYDYGWNASHKPLMEEFVEDVTDCSLHYWNTTGAGSWTTQQQWASAYQVYEEYGSSGPWAGACAGKEHILSCNGNTLFEAWRRETTSDAWVQALSYWVSANSVATWKMTASNCTFNGDRDDMKFKGTSEPGAYQHYTAIFIKWFGGGFCDFK